ncbi:MAG: hypothetical protein JXB60_08830, partial [Candidatus Cloacimonetes bacterium]|nr:hypothetical protein [Candidatus Cloacimonadota bacterium]
SLDDDREKWLSAIKSDNLLWTNVSNLKSWDNQAVEYYGVVAIPSNFLIDEKGVIIAKNLRTDKLYEQIRKILED